ncbi:MAG: sugar ABC transporter ATP-binding protein [Bradyrhizobium sp.]|nr:MAG: sugar ABC transporter ATP-binding protein [Bradyrhizobium sp.]
MRLAVENVGKSFPGVVALDGASLRLEPGEIHALVGENGAGKSTLIKILTGIYRPDRGRLTIDDKEARFASARDAIASGIGAVHQERNLVPRFTVGENIALEQLPMRFGFVDFDAVHKRARKFLDAIDSSIDTRTEVRRLSVAQMQIVEIAKALSLDSGVLLLDEPTASITGHEADALFLILRRLKAQGKAIAFVGHRLEEVLSICDRITVLRDGKVMLSGEPVAKVDRARVVREMVGREERIAEFERAIPQSDTPAMEARELATARGHVGIDFKLMKGEILGLYGLVGAGRTELARALVGDERIVGGQLLMDGTPVASRNVADAVHRQKIGYVSEDRKGEGLILAHSVRANLAITIWRRIADRLGLLRRSSELRVVAPIAARLDVRTGSLEREVIKLSGGNQQKVSIGKWLAAEVKVLLVDEPTVGVDVNAKAAIHEAIAGVAREGVAVLLISSDLPEMVALADRVLVMRDFALIGEVENDRNLERVSRLIMELIQSR